MFFKVFKVAMLASMACASVLPRSYARLVHRATQASELILMLAPLSNTCAGALYPEECATNAQAAPYLITAMQKYGIFESPEIAAVLSLMAFETGDFKFNLHHYPAPGTPGKGTRAMLSPTNVLNYARSFPELADKLNAITTASDVGGLSADQVNAIRALVLPDEYSWGSGPWYLATVCPQVREALKTGSQAGFEAYIGCVHTDVTPDRIAKWKQATAAFAV